MTKRLGFQVVLMVLGLMLVITACQRTALPSLSKEFDKTEDLLSDNKMFHIKQVIEFYDAQNNPIPRYFELFVAKDQRICHELDSDDNTIQIMIDIKDTYLSYNPGTLEAEKHESSPILSLDFAKMLNMTEYKVTAGESYEYCGRTCRVYGISNGDDTEDLRLYIDEETGSILFCDAPLFCIKTFSFEIIDYKAGFFELPDGLKYK